MSPESGKHTQSEATQPTADQPVREIVVLPEVVQNKIAAGEVVERPASVVKELVENAVDAGSNRITVELESGGHRLIRISDNGCGMNENNLVRSIERHATSKIRDVEDIFRITTMGFRGEALPSIGSVSKLKISTAPHEAETGHVLLVDGGKTERLSPCPPTNGTTVEVRDLFFNTPARKKFMKHPPAEVSAVSEILTRIALAHPHISFAMINDGKKTISLPSHGSLAERIAALFGSDIAGKLIPVDHEVEGLRIEGFVARPPESRPTSRGLYVFLNHRWIRHAGMAHVVADAFQGTLPPRRFPFGVLYLQLDPQRVDVNVHPTKEEVRFENDRLVLGSVRRAVDDALMAMRRQDDPRGMQIADAASSYVAGHSPSSTSYSRTYPSFGNSAQATTTPGNPQKHPYARLEAYAKPTSHTYSSIPEGKNHQTSALCSEQTHGLNSAACQHNPSDSEDGSAASPQAKLNIEEKPPYKIIGQAGNRYLIIEFEDGIRIIDQHALHERWNYEKLQDREHPVLSQRLLTPVVVELSPAESALFEVTLPILNEMGFEIERFGDNALAVNAHPEIVRTNQIGRLIRDVFTDLENGKNVMEQLRHTILSSLACRSAVLFGQSLTSEAILAVMQKFDEARQPMTCPHGRPTSIQLTWLDLAKRFERA